MYFLKKKNPDHPKRIHKYLQNYDLLINGNEKILEIMNVKIRKKTTSKQHLG